MVSFHEAKSDLHLARRFVFLKGGMTVMKQAEGDKRSEGYR